MTNDQNANKCVSGTFMPGTFLRTRNCTALSPLPYVWAYTDEQKAWETHVQLTEMTQGRYTRRTTQTTAPECVPRLAIAYGTPNRDKCSFWVLFTALCPSAGSTGNFDFHKEVNFQGYKAVFNAYFKLVSWLDHSSILNLDARFSSETSVAFPRNM
jgi:hypothetical protein